MEHLIFSVMVYDYGYGSLGSCLRSLRINLNHENSLETKFINWKYFQWESTFLT